MDLVAIIATGLVTAVVAGVAAGTQTGVAELVSGWFRRRRQGTAVGTAAETTQLEEAEAEAEPRSGGREREDRPVLRVHGDVHPTASPASSSTTQPSRVYHVTGNTNVLVGDHCTMRIDSGGSAEN